MECLNCGMDMTTIDDGGNFLHPPSVVHSGWCALCAIQAESLDQGVDAQLRHDLLMAELKGKKQ